VFHYQQAASHYGQRIILDTTRYVRFLFETWFGLVLTTFVGGLGPFDWFTMFFFAFGESVYFSVGLVELTHS
jgi:hypothetical protein